MIKTSYKKIILSITMAFTLASIFIGQKVFAAGLVPCDGIDDCNFDTFVKLLNGLTSFIMFRLPLILLVFFFAYNGGLLIIKGNRPGLMKEIKSNLLNLLWGYLLILGAYIIVKTVIVLLVGDNLSFKVFFN